MMTNKIQELTPEQEAQLQPYADKWIKIGLSTEPLDFENAKKAVIKCYKIVGLKEPTQFYHAKSPDDAIKLIKLLDPSKKETEILEEMIYGSNDAYWLAFYSYMKEVLDVKEIDSIDGLIELAHYCGWLNVYEDVVVMQDRPERIKFDEQNRLHCQDGPAIRYRDGYSVYAWHGVRVPAKWIDDPNGLTAQEALKVPNMEQRRAACEILGWAKILKDLKAKVIDEDVDPEIGTLVEVNIPEIGKERFLKVLCGTGREFAIPVPAFENVTDAKTGKSKRKAINTALEANAWTFGLPADMLRDLEVRT
jgi:hypothetical protein